FRSWSSAMTFCIMAHCSLDAPGGVSQMIDHAPCVARTVPAGCCCACAGNVMSNAAPAANAQIARRRTLPVISLPCESPQSNLDRACMKTEELDSRLRSLCYSSPIPTEIRRDGHEFGACGAHFLPQRFARKN